MPKRIIALNSASLKEYKVKNFGELMEKKNDENTMFTAEVNLKTVKQKNSNEEDNKFHAIFSDESMDRYGDIVVQNWDLKNFKNNPVYLDSHSYRTIGDILGKVEKIKVKDQKLQGDIIYSLSNPKGVMARDMTNEGMINASSVGFMIKDWKWEDDNFLILKAELLEISAVSVPANANALIDKKSYEHNDDDEDKGEDGKTSKNSKNNKIAEKEPEDGGDNGDGGVDTNDNEEVKDEKKELQGKAETKKRKTKAGKLLNAMENQEKKSKGFNEKLLKALD